MHIPLMRGAARRSTVPIAFDLTITSLFPTLLAGGIVFLLPEDATIETLAATLKDGDFSLVKLTPAHLAALSDEMHSRPPGIMTRAFVIGGEALSGEMLKWWRVEHPHIRLINEYGPTEATVGCCVFEVPPEFELQGPVPIGRPIHNVRLYVLDANLRPAATGVTGELYIAGDSLARGYHNRPELTAQSFLPDPFVSESGARMYRSGDLVRRLPDGNLEFLGRPDTQIKLRGFRIELSEVEVHLRQHPRVREVVVLAWGDPPNQRLVAYVTVKGPHSPVEDDLRGFLKQRLPEYMLPARYVVMDAFPLTTNGKIDRKALSVDGGVRNDNTSIALRDDLEARLSAIWERVLDIPSVGPHENFFDLGGHSLLATKLLMEVESELGRKVSLSALFQAATVGRMAVLLRGGVLIPNPRVVSIQSAGTNPPFFCFGAGPIFRALAQRLGSNQPFLGVHFDKDDFVTQPHLLEDFAAVHVRTILDSQPEGRYYLGGWSDNGVLAYEVARQLESSGHPVDLLVLFDAENPSSSTLTGIERFHARFDALCQWIRINWALLKNSGRQEFWERIRVGFQFRRTWLKDQIWKIVYALRRRTGLPPQPADSDRLLAYAIASYCPPHYYGRVILFQRSARPIGRYHDPLFGWGGLAGKLEVHEIPGDHRDMFLEPHVDVLAEKLKELLTGT